MKKFSCKLTSFEFQSMSSDIEKKDDTQKRFSLLELAMPLRLHKEGSVLEVGVGSNVSEEDDSVLTCHVHSDFTCPDTCVQSLVMQSAVSAASQHDGNPGPGGVLVIMAGDPWSQLPPSWHQVSWSTNQNQVQQS